MKKTKRFSLIQSGFAPLITILVITILGVVGYVGYKNYQKNLSVAIQTTPTHVPTDQVVQDDRDCIGSEQKIAFSESFFVNKWFENFSASGEWGLLKVDHTIPLNWARDWAGPNDTRPTSKIAEWSTGVDTLILSKTTLSDGSWTGFRYFSYKGNIFAVPKEYDGIVFGPSKVEIEDFFNNQIFPMWENSTGCHK